MKIGILTITGGENFGNRLQNYALQEVLKQYADKVETIKNYTRAEDEYKKVTVVKKMVKWTVASLTFKTPINKESFNFWYRQKVFDRFNRKHIDISSFIVSKDNIPEGISEYYDYFVSGSDQVWNPHYLFNSHVDFMDFADEKQRISYAASFGVDEIPESKREQYTEWIKGIPFVSVREEQGAEIIKELTGKDVPVLVDPTLLLTRQEWESMARKPKWLNTDNYILAYYLGENAEKINESVEEISNKYNLPVIKLNRKNLKNEYSTSPEEFLYLVKHCKLLCTDSFHGTIFAYQMNRPVVIYDRALMENEVAMNSRMDMIQKLLNVGNRVINNLDINSEELFKCDYSYADDKVADEREKTHRYLKKALEE